MDDKALSLDLSFLVPKRTGSEESGEFDKEEESAYEFAKDKDHCTPDEYEARKRKLDLQDREEIQKQRRKFSHKAFSLVVYWMGLVLATVWADAATVRMQIEFPFIVLEQFDIDTTVLAMLVGTSSANVIGLLVIYFKYLFPSK